MKTTFEFSGKGYLWLSAGEQRAILSEKTPTAELELNDGAEIEAVHSENEQKEKEKLTPFKIAVYIFLLPLALAISLIASVLDLLANDGGFAPERFFDKNNPFKTKKKFILEKAGETIKISVYNPVFARKTLEYIVLPQIEINGKKADSAEYSYEQKYTRESYNTDNYSKCIAIGVLTLILAGFGILFIFNLPHIKQEPVDFILGLLASLLLIASTAIAVWATVKTEKSFKKTEVNIINQLKGDEE
ncbi:MAG: hypothetical protein IJX27_01465 [Clostridia bacterium]|nr:hypothetical protein [Clostridia bacterium]